METARFRFRMSGPQSPRQRQKLHSQRGRASTGQLRVSDNPDARRSVNGPVKFVRNPKHPKNLYAAEMSIRQVGKGKPVKVSSGMSFPDPKSAKSIRNPTAPRFQHEFDPSEKDYDIITNPLAGMESVHASIPNTGNDKNNFIYVDDSDNDNGSDDSYDSATRFSIIEDDDIEIEDSEKMQDDKEPSSIFLETPSLLETDAPGFAPQPPPPRGPSAVLVIPRAVVRENDANRNRARETAQNGERTYLNIGP
ncbi:uncharacterized protein [Asterias amurensis]|uniref:uncharacterized protein n=1 Tax=Asterias amurensis TaxID=7602 RepID=UPI003AB535A0